jgi:hypothetical protein
VTREIIITIIIIIIIKAEIESKVVAAQDEALQTKYYATKLLNTEREHRDR